MALEHDLKNVGLNYKEAKIYLVLLELGSGSIAEISRKSGIKRTTVYEVLKPLLKRGLISQTILGRRKKFFAEDPRAFFQNKKAEMTALETLIPTLDALRNVSTEKPTIQFFQGVEDLKKIFEDMILNTDPLHDKLLSIGGSPNILSDRWSEKFWTDLLLQKKKRGLQSLAIQTTKKDRLEKFAKAHPYGFGHGLTIRLLEDMERKFNMSIYLYQNKIAILAEDQFFAIIIENKRLQESFRFLFYVLWNNAEEMALTSEKLA